MIGHAGDVIADYAGQRLGFGFVLIVVRERFRMVHPESEQLTDDAFGRVFLIRQRRAEIESFVEKVFVPLSLAFRRRTEGGEALETAANVVERTDVAPGDALPGVSDQVIDEVVQDALE